MSPKVLHGRRVLIVEDRYLIASELADEIERLGGRVVGPSRDLADARRVLAGEAVDIALLDVNLEGETVYPLAQTLDEQGVPIIFLTGYDAETMPEPWRERPRVTKPVDLGVLRRQLLNASAPEARR